MDKICIEYWVGHRDSLCVMTNRRIPVPTGIRIRPSCPHQIADSWFEGKNDDNRKIIIDLSNIPLEDAACAVLSKGVYCAASLAVMPAENILCEVEKAIGVLLEDTAENVGQETIRILIDSYKPKDNLSWKRSPFRP